LEALPKDMNIFEILQTYWGFSQFRTGQQAVIESVISGRDTIAILPTGGGKSLCYQVPALAMDGITMVITPLIALMKDQVEGLQTRGISAACMHSGLKQHEIDQMWTDAEFGRFKLLYVSPERLKSDMFLARAERLPVRLLAVDEAHCISEWGDHFRPAYLDIPAARILLKNPPIIAVTATATPKVRQDIREKLALESPFELVQGFDRPNITWSVFRMDNKRAKVLEILQKVQGSGILYASTRKHVEAWAAWLNEQNIAAFAYHGGMETQARSAIQDKWMKNQGRVMVATNAFGMGIDKPDVRFVIHTDLPANLEAYYQEAGRAGRDGKRSFAILLWQKEDIATQESMIEEGFPDAASVQQVYDAVCNLAQVPLGSEWETPLLVNQAAVTQQTGLSGGKIKQAITMLQRAGVWQSLPHSPFKVQIRFKQPIETLRDYAQRETNPKLTAFIQDLIRAVNAEAFTSWYDLDLRTLARRTNLSDERLRKGLDFLAIRELLAWKSSDDGQQLQLLQPRTQSVVMDHSGVLAAKKRAKQRLKFMMRYAAAMTCRRHFLLSYFGETSSPNCGTCDVCLGRHKPEVITPKDEEALRTLLEAIDLELPRKMWFDDQKLPDHYIDSLLAWLLHEGYLKVVDPLKSAFSLTPKALKFLEIS
jgi:ATP-dependent DNA helicase RecQ